MNRARQTAVSEPPLAASVRRQLRKRLRRVRELLRAAATGEPHDPEAVHDFRVWTRRAGASLQISAPFLPAGKRKRWRRRLRDLRRTAARVRDCDVFQQRLFDGDVGGLEGSGIADDLLTALIAERDDAQRLLERSWRRNTSAWPRKVRALLRKVKWRKAGPCPLPSGLRERALRKETAALRRLLQNVSANAGELHQLRLRLKRLRYTVEAVDQLEGRPASEIGASLRALQDRLGRISDHAAAVEMLRRLAPRLPDPALTELQRSIDEEERRMHRTAGEFVSAWQEGESRLFLEQLEKLRAA